MAYVQFHVGMKLYLTMRPPRTRPVAPSEKELVSR